MENNMNGQGMDGQGMDGQGMSGNVGSNAGGNIPNMNNMNNTPPNMPNMGGMGMGEMPNMGAMNGMPNMGGINNPPPNMGGMNGNMPNMGGMYNMPPNMNNRMNMGQDGFSLKNIMGVIDKFTKDIDKIVIGISESIEGALNGSSVTNGINNINQALDNAQRFDGGQQVNGAGQVNPNTEQAKVMQPVMGRSTISLSNGNEVGKLPEMAESLPSEYGYLAEPDNQTVNNIGQMVTPEIHSVLDKQEDMGTPKNKPVSLYKVPDTIIENEGVASVENTETIVDSNEAIVENREFIEESTVAVANTEGTVVENVKASPVSLKKHTDENNDPPVSEVE